MRRALRSAIPVSSVGSAPDTLARVTAHTSQPSPVLLERPSPQSP